MKQKNKGTDQLRSLCIPFFRICKNRFSHDAAMCFCILLSLLNKLRRNDKM